MQGGRDPFFGFGDPFGSFGGQRSQISSFLGGKDPFDDPFFTRPFGSMFGSSFFGSNGGPYLNPVSSGFLEHQPTRLKTSRGPVIEELNSDDEVDEKESGKGKKENPRKHGRYDKDPFVEDPDDEGTGKKSKHMVHQNEVCQAKNVWSEPQTHSFTFQSTTVSYGGANGAYYTSRTRRSGSDGLTFEECKEADSSTHQATHRVSRGIHDKGHSITRKLNSDGHVATMQTLHNINEDELAGFEEAWKGNARKYLLGLGEGFTSRDATGSGGTSQGRHNNRGGLTLPSTLRSNNQESLKTYTGGMAAAHRRSERSETDSSGPSRTKSNGTRSCRQTKNRC